MKAKAQALQLLECAVCTKKKKPTPIGRNKCIYASFNMIGKSKFYMCIMSKSFPFS